VEQRVEKEKERWRENEIGTLVIGHDTHTHTHIWIITIGFLKKQTEGEF